MSHRLRVTRLVAAPRDRVFHAWTDAREIARWWLPPGFENPVIEVDLRVGGSFRLGMRQTGKEMFYALGTFTEVSVPKRVVCTWRWEPAALLGLDPGDSELIVEFRERGAKTEVILTHRKIPARKDRDDFRTGWTGCLERLASLVE